MNKFILSSIIIIILVGENKNYSSVFALHLRANKVYSEPHMAQEDKGAQVGD